MKKIVIALMAIALIFSFTSCNDSPSKTPVDAETVKSYFSEFATQHIFGEIKKAFDETSTEITGLTAAKAGEDASATVTATFTAKNLRFNGQSVNPEKHRLANGTFKATLTGKVSENTFTADSLKLEKGEGSLVLSDSAKTLPSLNVETFTLDVPFSGKPAFTVDSEKVTAMASEASDVKLDWANATAGTITVDGEVYDVLKLLGLTESN